MHAAGLPSRGRSAVDCEPSCCARACLPLTSVADTHCCLPVQLMRKILDTRDCGFVWFSKVLAAANEGATVQIQLEDDDAGAVLQVMSLQTPAASPASSNSQLARQQQLQLGAAQLQLAAAGAAADDLAAHVVLMRRGG